MPCGFGLLCAKFRPTALPSLPACGTWLSARCLMLSGQLAKQRAMNGAPPRLGLTRTLNQHFNGIFVDLSLMPINTLTSLCFHLTAIISSIYRQHSEEVLSALLRIT
ncbi:hypothetical protein Tcan_15784 [Toxocara canis]|uniref:Uncharacterized protein n=1 Tax=Toxocara canis TaxID=6265 RepID=A0A0B2V7Y3_TOXCA|nr:hypothetical protein Tcan_15784 [Toxocara canis]